MITNKREKVIDARKSINTARKSFKEARINYNSHMRRQKLFLFGPYAGWGVFEVKSKKVKKLRKLYFF